MKLVTVSVDRLVLSADKMSNERPSNIWQQSALIHITSSPWGNAHMMLAKAWDCSWKQRECKSCRGGKKNLSMWMGAIPCYFLSWIRIRPWTFRFNGALIKFIATYTSDKEKIYIVQNPHVLKFSIHKKKSRRICKSSVQLHFPNLSVFS